MTIVSNTKKYFTLSLLLCISIPQTTMLAKDPQQSAKITIAESPISILDSLVDTAQKQINTVQILLSGLSSMINDNQITLERNKKDVLRIIKELNLVIDNIQREKFINLDVGTAVFLLQFNDALIKHILRAIRSNFALFGPLDIAPIVTRSFKQQVSLSDVQRLITQNKKQLDILNKETDQAGLRWYNKAYRVLNQYAIAPSIKYSIPMRATLLAAGTGAALWIWWRLGHESFKKSTPAWVYDTIFGALPERSIMGTLENKDDLRLLGKAEYYLSELNRGFLPIGAALATFTYAGLKAEGESIKKPFTKKLTVLHNTLMGGAYLKAAQKAAQRVDEVYFDDLVGLEHAKAEFKILVDYLANPEPYDRLGLTPPRGILLDGKTRTGKSHLIKACFGEINRMLKQQGRSNEFRFIELQASTINQEGIGKLLYLIKSAAPCIVFIDEIDLLDLQRKGKNETLSEFLTCMSGTVSAHDPKNQVIIIGATNRPENLDTALRQPGRFGKEIHFDYPAYEDRETYIRRKINKLSLNEESFDIERLAQETEGHSYEALNILVNNAVLKARIRGQVVNQKHIDETLDDELRHIIVKDHKDIPSQQKELIASYFAGQALFLNLEPSDIILSKVTIKPVMTDIKEELMGIHLYSQMNSGHSTEETKQQKRLEYGRIFTHKNKDSINLESYAQKIIQIKLHVAGFIAQEIVNGQPSAYSCHPQDHQHALNMAQSLAFEGFDHTRLPKHIQKDRFDKAFAILEQCKQEVRTLLTQHKDTLVAITNELVCKELLSGTQITNIINPEPEEVVESQGETPDQSIIEQELSAALESTEQETAHQETTGDTPIAS